MRRRTRLPPRKSPSAPAFRLCAKTRPRRISPRAATSGSSADPTDGTFAQNLIDFMGDLKKKKNIEIKKIAILHEDGLFGTGSADSENADALKAGYTVVANIAYSATTTDVSAEVQKIKVAAPDVLMITSYLPDSLLFMRGLRIRTCRSKQSSRKMPASSIRTSSRRSARAPTVCSPAKYFRSTSKNRNQSVPLIDQLYRARFGGKPLDGNSAREIMGVLVLADATQPREVRSRPKRSASRSRRRTFPANAR